MKSVQVENINAALSRAGAQRSDNIPKNLYYQIASIIIVGGLLHDDGSLTDNDLRVLEYFSKACVALGLQLSSGMTVQACNLEYGDDFIRDTPQADLLIFSWVNHGVNEVRDKKIGGESPLLYEGYTWQKAIGKSSAPFVGLITDNFTCVGRNDIPENYTVVHTLPQKTVFDYPLYQKNTL